VRLKHESVPSLDCRVTYATRRYFANKELRNMVNTGGKTVGKTVGTIECFRQCHETVTKALLPPSVNISLQITITLRKRSLM